MYCKLPQTVFLLFQCPYLQLCSNSIAFPNAIKEAIKHSQRSLSYACTPFVSRYFLISYYEQSNCAGHNTEIQRCNTSTLKTSYSFFLLTSHCEPSCLSTEHFTSLHMTQDGVGREAEQVTLRRTYGYDQPCCIL